MIKIRTYRTGDEQIIYEMLASSGRLLQLLACFEPANELKPGDVRELTANPQFNPDGTCFAVDGDRVLGFTVASEHGVHVFHVPDAHFDEAAPLLLDHLIAWWRRQGCTHVRQCRMKPVPGSISSLSDVFQLDTDRAYIDLYRSRGFAECVESANMYVDLRHWSWAEAQKAKRARLADEGVSIRPADRADIARLLRSQVSHIEPISLPHLNSNRPDALQMAFVDDQVIGYCGFFPWTMHNDLPELGHIHVLTEHRSRGIGEMLLCALLEWGVNVGMKRVRLSCSHDETPRFHIYGKAGFTLGEKWYQKMALEL